MRKILFLTSIFISLCISTAHPVVVFAQTPSVREDTFGQLGAAAGSNGANFGNPTDPRILAANIIKIILGVLGTIFLVLAVYAGFLWMTAGGEEENISKAKKMLYNAVIGLAVVLSAYSLTLFVSSRLLEAIQGGSNDTLEVPQNCLDHPMAPECQG